MPRLKHTREPVAQESMMAPALRFSREPEERQDSPPPFSLCLDALKFVEWIDRELPDVSGEENTLSSLDRALLVLTKEYLYRSISAERHRPATPGSKAFICLPEVYHQKAQELFEQQLEILRATSFQLPSTPLSPPTKEPEPKPELFIGEEDE